MTTTLQQALLKAGLINKEQLKKAETDKKQARRPPAPERPRSPSPQHPRGARPPGKTFVKEDKKTPGFIEGKHHHHMRTQCDACHKTSPDVEYYEHKNRSLECCWLCVRCADAHNISDDYRQTVQSQHAQAGRFRREYGATKIFK